MSHLYNAIESTPDVRGHACFGLQALCPNARSKIKVPNNRLLTCSLDIDSATQLQYPNDNRWDYALEYNNETFFIEVHPAHTSEIPTVLAKLAWLQQWLKNRAPLIEETKSLNHHPYYWICSGKYAISPISPQARLLATKKIKPLSFWNFNALK